MFYRICLFCCFIHLKKSRKFYFCQKKNMISFEDAELRDIAVHFVGNQVQEEDLKISEGILAIDDAIKELLRKYFTRFFKDQPFKQFTHNSDLAFNECYAYLKEIFDNSDDLYLNSVKLAKHLYQVSDHPNIKSGEFYVAYFDQVYVGDEVCAAIGLFKSENKDTFLRVYPENQNYKIESDHGVNINKLDKGCLVFNSEQDQGFKVMIIDNTNKNAEARYWTEKFLQVQPRQDNYFHTQNYLMMCKEFSMEAFPDASQADKLSLARESEKFFKEQELFDKISFHEKVLQEPEIIDAFEDYKSKYQEERNVQVVDEFDIAPAAVKKLKSVFKSVIKLDKNFHIYVHGNRDYIKKGYDEECGLNFYQVFFKEES